MRKKNQKTINAQFLTADGLISNLEKVPFPPPRFYVRSICPSRHKFQPQPDHIQITRREYILEEVEIERGIPNKAIYKEYVK